MPSNEYTASIDWSSHNGLKTVTVYRYNPGNGLMVGDPVDTQKYLGWDLGEVLGVTCHKWDIDTENISVWLDGRLLSEKDVQDVLTLEEQTQGED